MRLDDLRRYIQELCKSLITLRHFRSVLETAEGSILSEGIWRQVPVAAALKLAMYSCCLAKWEHLLSISGISLATNLSLHFSPKSSTSHPVTLSPVLSWRPCYWLCPSCLRHLSWLSYPWSGSTRPLLQALDFLFLFNRDFWSNLVKMKQVKFVKGRRQIMSIHYGVFVRFLPSGSTFYM